MAPKSTPTTTSSSSRVLYWFRTDLRITDSPALTAALSLPSISSFYPIWCFDPTYVYSHRVGLNRWSFLLESMSSLSDELTRLNPNQKLLVVRGPPEKVLPKVMREWGITHLVFEKDVNGYGRVRDKEVKEMAKKVGVKVVEVQGRHLFDPEEVVEKNGGKPTMTVAQWKAITKKMGPVSQPSPPVTSLPNPGDTTLDLTNYDLTFNKTLDANSHIRTSLDTCFETLTGPSSDFSVPTLSSLGFPLSTTSIRGGITEAHRRLSHFLSNPERVATFSKPNTAPTAIEPSTTLLSPYLKFGCLGVRELWWSCLKVIEELRKEKKVVESKEPENMFGQLEFRDMYATAECGVKNFERIRGNSVCRYIDWGLQNQYDKDGKEILPRPKGSEEDEERFLAWKEGRTGFPWIDASMRQLKEEGWIHHLARHSVACFLTRGQCYISWERGMEVFDEWLIDWDPASNPGNWMWLSCSAFFSQYFRVYGLVSWPSKTDTTGALVRKYCPELKHFPDKYIYSPHLAPLSIQKSSHCIIGTDYPSPILDEQVEKNRCIARLKVAFNAGFHGDSREVLEGKAQEKLMKLQEASGGVKEEKKEGEMEKAEKKRKREGNGSLDGFVKRTRRG